jgi:hypothetical protein
MRTFYAGVGSRSTPPDVLRTMHGIACELRELGYTLRSGGASGADTAFEDGAGKHGSVLYLPWQGFNNRTRGIVCGDVPWMREVAKDFHPAWEACSRGARAMHTRNVPQVLGESTDVAASSFVVCWTPGGAGGGGTGQALRIAHFCGIPVYDLGAADGLERFRAGVLKV